MDRYSYEVRHWLDLRYDPDRLARIGHHYAPYQPITGIADGAWTNGTVSMAGRMARLCADVEALGARSLLDVGGAEGLVCETVRRVTGIESVSSDLSLAASRRAHQAFGLPALACEADRLPFADGAFDVVYCGEVIEHLARPIEALLELARVARRALIVTSEEAVFDVAERNAELSERVLDAHMDRSILVPGDLSLVLPDLAWSRSNQLRSEPVPAPTDAREVRARLDEWLAIEAEQFDGFGLYALGVHARQATAAPAAGSLEAVLEALAPRELTPSTTPTPIPPALAQRLRCPACGGPLAYATRIRCTSCGRTYGAAEAVPDLCLALDDAPPPHLEQRLEAYPEEARRQIFELDARFAFPMPTPIDADRLPLDPTQWSAGPGVCLEPHQGALDVESRADDPSLVSPRLARPLAKLRRLRVRLEVLECAQPSERLQVFFKTLQWPLFWEGASVGETYETTPGIREFEFAARDTRFFAQDDELIELRIDPTDGPARIRLLEVALVE